MPSYTPSTVPTSSVLPSISHSPSLEPSTSLAPSLSGRPSLGPSSTLAPSSCHELWIELQYDDYATSTSFELISIDQGIIILRQDGTSEDSERTREEIVCLEPGQHQFRTYFKLGGGFWGSYNLKLRSGETVIDRNRDKVERGDPTVDGYGEIVRFDLPFRTPEIEPIGGIPTESPTFSIQPSVSTVPSLEPTRSISTQPSVSTVPSLAPTSSIHPSMTQNPSASQAPSFALPRGTTLVGKGNCVDSSDEGYTTLDIEASEFKDGFSAELCLDKCISLSFIIQLQLRGFEPSDLEGKPCACLFDHDPDDIDGDKFTEELQRENGFSFSLDYNLERKGAGPVSSSLVESSYNPFCYEVDNDVSITSWMNSFQHPPN